MRGPCCNVSKPTLGASRSRCSVKMFRINPKLSDTTRARSAADEIAVHTRGGNWCAQRAHPARPYSPRMRPKSSRRGGAGPKSSGDTQKPTAAAAELCYLHSFRAKAACSGTRLKMARTDHAWAALSCSKSKGAYS